MEPDSVRQQTHQAIQRRLSHKLICIELLQQVLTHRSPNVKNNERFEFIGNAILNYSIAKMLFDALPKLAEGKLSRLHANLINEHMPAEIALEMNIDDGLYPGAGELKSGGFRRPSILADAMETMFAAVSLDAGFAVAGEVVRHLFAERIRWVDFKSQGKDSKMVLQEVLQARHPLLSKYRIEERVDGVKDSCFAVPCDLGGLGFTCRAQGTNRRVAEQKAATKALIWPERQLPLKKNKK